MQYIIGIDIGTSGTKAIAFSTEGKVLGSALQSYPVLSPRPGEHELNPELILHAVCRSTSQLVHKTGHTHQLTGLSFSCAMHSLIAMDKNGSALTHAMTWADLRSKQQAAILNNMDAGRDIYEHCGTPVHPMLPLCKIIWLKEKTPAIFQHTDKFISIKEFIWFRFFGKYQVDFSIASATGLFDNSSLCWYGPALASAGINTGQLSELVPPTHIEKGIQKSYKDLMGIGPDLAFVIGANDGCLANLGCNAVHPGEMALTIGTSGAARMVSWGRKPVPHGQLFTYILWDQCYVCGGAINNGGAAVKWWVEKFMEKPEASQGEFASFLQEIDSIDPGSEGLVCLPYLLGERSPVWDADAKAVFFGIHARHGPRHFLRSLIEGISFSLYQIGLYLEAAIGPINKIYASGGFIQSELWLQMIADLFNKEVCVTNNEDASAIGAAILGRYAMGDLSSLEKADEWIKPLQTFYPSQKHHHIYLKNYAVFAGLYTALKDEFALVSGFSG